MTEYVLTLKLIHIIGAVVLLGTGFGISLFLFMANRTRDPFIIAHTASVVVLADAAFTANALIVLPVSGIYLVQAVGYSIWEPWIVLSLALYVVVGLCSLPALWLQAKLRDLAREAVELESELPRRYHRLFRVWLALGWPALIGVIAIYVLMIFKPALW
jgi:uncharacterized membrane protein